MELPSLGAPAQLWWLAAVLPLLWWLAQPPRPKQVHWTAHLPQWLRAEASVRRRPPRFRALRWLLLTLAACAVVLASAAPTAHGVAGPQRLAVLVDSSASMLAGADGGALARALAQVQREVGALPGHVAVDVFACGEVPMRRSGTGGRPPDLAGMVASGPLPGTWDALVAAAAKPGTAVWVLTDGQHGPAPQQARGTLLGSAASNAALELAQIVDHWPQPAIELSVVVHNFGKATRATLHCSGALVPVADTALQLPDSGTVRVELALQRTTAGGRIEIQLTSAEDALASDNQVAFAVPPLPAPTIAVLAEEQGSVFVRAAARALADEVAGSVVEGAVGNRADFLLVEGGTVPLATGAASFAAFGVLAPGAKPMPWALPTGIDWDRGAPLVAGLDFSDLYVQTALAQSLPAGKVLVHARNAAGAVEPLMVLVTGEHSTSLHTAFRLQDSNLPLLPAFPQLLRRVWLAGLGGEAGIPLPKPPDLTEADLRNLPAPRDGVLPDFGQPQLDLAPWFLWAAALLLSLRLCLR